VLGRLAALTPRHRTLIAIGAVLVIVAVPLRGLLNRQGPPMEEGFMLVFAEQFLHGAVPNKDFLYLYGPGSVWFLAGVFKLFGVSLLAERLVGLAQLLGIIFGVFFLVLRAWGRVLAVLGATITALIILPPIALTALAWNGAVAFGLFAMVAGIASTRARTARGANGLAATSGALFGLALLWRPDLILASVLVVAFLMPQLARSARRWLAGAAAAFLGLYLIQIAMAGLHNVVQGIIVDPVFNLRGGRRLPVPPRPNRFDGFLINAGERGALKWAIPSVGAPAQLTIWFFLLLFTLVLLVGVSWFLWRHLPHDLRTLTLVLVTAFSIGILPQALQRPDTTHVAWVTCVPFGFLPVLAVEILRARKPALNWTRLVVLGMLPILAVLYLLIPNYTLRDYADISAQTFGLHRNSYEIKNDGRNFYYGRRQVQEQLTQILHLADRVSKPGQRLFVGTGDLRKTPYSDAFIYYMLPDLKPATYYIEMDPGVANAKNSRLASDVASADIVILSRVWDKWAEPNDSLKYGPEKPNDVLKAHFCTVKNDPLYALLVRCAHGNAPVP
jgi:hypothetical protein